MRLAVKCRELPGDYAREHPCTLCMKSKMTKATKLPSIEKTKLKNLEKLPRLPLANDTLVVMLPQWHALGVRFSARQLDALRRAAKARGLSVTELVRLQAMQAAKKVSRAA